MTTCCVRVGNMMGRSVVATLATVLALVGLAGCGDSDDAATSASEPVELADQSFVSGNVVGHDLVEGSQITLSFEDDRLAVNAGCNNISGGYTHDDGALAWDGPALSTKMACDPALMDQDQWLNSLLEDGVETSSDGADLVLSSGDVTMEFSRVDQ